MRKLLKTNDVEYVHGRNVRIIIIYFIEKYISKLLILKSYELEVPEEIVEGKKKPEDCIFTSRRKVN